MNVGQLKRLLATVSDDVEVVVSGHDHSYEKARAQVAEAEKWRDNGHMSEWYGEANRTSPTSDVVKVLVVG